MTNPVTGHLLNVGSQYVAAGTEYCRTRCTNLSLYKENSYWI